jgi:hypothetical protein
MEKKVSVAVYLKDWIVEGFHFCLNFYEKHKKLHVMII